MKEYIGAPQGRSSWTKKYSLITFTDAELPSGIWRIDPLCIWKNELVCNGNEMSTVSETECEKNIEVNEIFGIFGGAEFVESVEVNEMFGSFGETESEENAEVLNVYLCLSNLRTNELRKIATGRCNNEFSVIFNHAESLVPIDSIHIRKLNTMRQKIVDGNKQFPQEIIRNILKRLPVKSLMRFQCVCKQWKNLIKTPSFISDHLHHSTYHNPSLLFQRNGRDRDVPLDLCLLDCEKRLYEVQNIPFDSLLSVKIISSSNGLLCVERSSHRIHSLFLWNPAIRKIRQVHSNVYDFDGCIHVGYGFSSRVNDYKILRVYIPEEEDEVDRLEVYSLSTQRWKEIKRGTLKGVNLYSVTANGTMFWLGSKLDTEEDLVVSFDIAMESFTLIAMPPLDKNHKYWCTPGEIELD
ncbi:putative F-box protein At3g10430 isoform X2 [Prosopis cineraria]|uniref:putative F-box protein At3g10430 isoform X2 n=1 Tax=Prosopis cineraria TaxID=364024 RepID=UPI00240F036B|nr:putative F-box protein At3g10430 isoform X2 [Prosopis cineraria]